MKDEALKEYAEMMRLTGWTKDDMREYRNVLDAQIDLVRVKLRLILIKKCLLGTHEITALLAEAIGAKQEVTERTDVDLLKRVFKGDRAEAEAV